MPYPSPATLTSFAHYTALQASLRYIPIDRLEGDFIYLMHGRNSYLGIWLSAPPCFVILRYKLGRLYLDSERHWDTDTRHGTAKPFLKLSGPVAKDQRRHALDAAHAIITHDEFMSRTALFI